MDTSNSAVLTTDILVDATRTLAPGGAATPLEFHSLNSLIEAAVLHNELYVPWGVPNEEVRENPVLKLLQDEQILHVHSYDLLAEELQARNLFDISILEDMNWSGGFISGGTPAETVDTLGALIDFDTNLGLSRAIGVDELMMTVIDESRDSVTQRSWAALFAPAIGFVEDDIRIIAGTSHSVRGSNRIAQELGLEMYTGLIFRPFLLGHWSDERRGARRLYARMQKELDDLNDTDIPGWSRIEIPILTQIVLRNCQGDPKALGPEILALRERQGRYRVSMSEYRVAANTAKTRGEKRKIRMEHAHDWNSLISKDRKATGTVTRLIHRVLRIAGNPTPLSVGGELTDELVHQVDLARAAPKIDGLTDLWAELSDAPTIEQNIRLIADTLGYEPDYESWQAIHGLGEKLEALMRRDELPVVPGLAS